VISDSELLEYIRPASDEDLGTLRRLERAAVAHVEMRTGRYFGHESEVIEYLPRYGNVIQLANTPLGDVTFESWDGTAWTEVDATGYNIIERSIEFPNTSAWNIATGPTRYRATYDAGYTETDGDSTEAPDDVKQAVLMLVAHWNENREAVVVGSSSSGALDLAVDSLLAPHTRLAV
jgi:uncharacterized phiE125 gp8 family phage protein